MSAAESKSTSTAPAAEPAIVVADLGSRSKKSLRKLRKGEGRLLGDVKALMAQLKADAVAPEGAQAVVFVVKEKRRAPSLPF